ncbi:hypothetical protein AMTR_s00021p00204400 [Amborella trichopoda]|uniref:Uncharacterized protein n=1 Tax=Amborella trichopoda TaxID=13333 RepID=W1PZY6_AMBTC|nr:hypothetical protein AMTR_s00021p00204400 [Amborella trichopoda]
MAHDLLVKNTPNAKKQRDSEEKGEKVDDEDSESEEEGEEDGEEDNERRTKYKKDQTMSEELKWEL